MLVQLVLLAGACRCVKSPPTISEAPPMLVSDDASKAPEPRSPEDEQWRAWLRVGDYGQASRGFDALHPEPRAAPLRYARARMAFELGEHALVLRLTEALEQELPSLAASIHRWRALAALEIAKQGADASASSREAALTLAGSNELEDALRGVRSLIELGERSEAKRILSELVERARAAGKRHWAEARQLRAELAESSGELDAATEDYRWLSFEATVERAAEGADVEFERLTRRSLSKRQRYERAESFTRAGRVKDAERELSLLGSAPGERVAEADLARTRAWAHYRSRGDYALAAELFTRSSKLDARFRTQDAFFAARALSRAHRDEEAIEAYRRIARDNPDSRYGEEALYLTGRLNYVLGRWEAAARDLTAYLTRHGKGRFVEAARYERAVANLARGRGDLARSELESLAARSKSPRATVQLRQLLGVAWLQQGQRERASEVFRSVIEQGPLSFAALASAARLSELGLPRSAPILPSDPEPASPALALRLPHEVALLADVGLDVEAEAELRLRADEFAQVHAPRSGEALCDAYGQLAIAKERYRHAQRVVKERVLERSLTERTRWLWDCIYPRPYAPFVESVAARYRIAPELVFAVMRQESAFAPEVVSPAGAVGLMQLMPRTAASAAAELGWEPNTLDVRRPGQNIELGVYYLRRLEDRVAGNVPLMAASYNAGPTAVGRWLKTSGGLPLDLFVARIPYEETRNYVQRVVGNWARYAYVRGGEAAIPELGLELPQSASFTSEDY